MHVSRHLNFKEKAIAFLLAFVFFSALIFWMDAIWKHYTIEVPKTGGEYAEGVVGHPLYVNPLLSQSSDADADLVKLIYSGLFKYGQDGMIENDLADRYEISEDGKAYTIYLKKNAVWHDNAPVTAADVVFTINILEDQTYRSTLRQSWQGIAIDQVDDYTVHFVLKSPYNGFLGKLTLGILPKHIWEGVGPEKFSLSELNLKPIGSGPYMFSSIQKDSEGNVLSLDLAANEKYYDGAPYISKFSFSFYPDEDMMAADYNKKEIKGMSNIAPEKLDSISGNSTAVHEISLSQNFVVLFNQNKNAALANDDVRKALAYGVDRTELINNILKGKGIPAYSPFLPTMKEYEDGIEKYAFDIDKANEILDKAGWKKNDEGVRKKGETELAFKIHTLDWPELSDSANLLASQWKKIGAKVEVVRLTVSDLQQNYIRPREYDSILIGQDIGFNPDPYSYWHSSQKDDPGLNLALFKSDKADNLLEDARQQQDAQKRIDNYKEFQKIIADKIPAVFLFSNNYLYPVRDEVKGIEVKNINTPAGRFSGAAKWYVKTKRVLK